MNILINKIIDESKNNTIRFRGEDLYNTYLESQEIEIPKYVTKFSDEEHLSNQNILQQFHNFKKELLSEWIEKKLYFIASHDDYLDIYSTLEQYNDEIHIDEINIEYDRLDELICSTNLSKEEKEKLINKQFDLTDEIRSLRSKYR